MSDSRLRKLRRLGVRGVWLVQVVEHGHKHRLVAGVVGGAGGGSGNFNRHGQRDDGEWNENVRRMGWCSTRRMTRNNYISTSLTMSAMGQKERVIVVF